ncbi:MAG: pyruvate kinase [Fimbriimonadaceae bacterium]|nr:pyruvate kinase [Fimbriimonadaceae bacterium]
MATNRRTKIVCTLGPAVDAPILLAALVREGMNVARLNCSHGDWETRRRWVERIRTLSNGPAPVGILVDLQGPKFRIGVVEGGRIAVRPGEILRIGVGPGVGIPIEQPEILGCLERNRRLLLGDGNVSLKVLDGEGTAFRARAQSGGVVTSRQGVTVVGKVFDVPALTPKDYEDAREACRLGVDFLALSYVKGPDDVLALRRFVADLDPKVKIVAKIETRQAVKRIDEIIAVSDVLMVARGDMGLQMEIEEVPAAQKRIIARCAVFGKPVITATQMLESMVASPRPTRAEASDVANAILDGTDAVMLSGETAAGEYPIEALRAMARIAERTDATFDNDPLLRDFERRARLKAVSHTEAVAHAVAELADLIEPAAILTTTTSGQTARLVSKFRPAVPILCATWDSRTERQMSVVWGVEAVSIDLPRTTDEIVASATARFLCDKRLKEGDTLVLTAGVPAGTPGNTNLILTHTVPKP